jgi:hypothetical protein
MTYHVIIQIQGFMSNIIRETYDTPPDTQDINMIEKNYTEQYGSPAIVTNVFSTQGCDE